MKFIKFSIIALVLTASVQFAKAQVRVGASIHLGYNQPRRIVHPVYYSEPAPVYYEQPVYVNRPVYVAPIYRRVYYRPQYRRVVYREHFYEGHGRGHGWGRGGRRW
ncbi:hypothetical protein [Mucilaginibacter psychrotolerans]|uniref:Virulence factor n=1 Tax=Mucilaginibacter psychrotolerans TaxID=1524096 RepID=A0A4Y8S9H5_9SPHI|nr:hypothetical protein [Mucilaginibacter psychrotolerans]TFF35341.1 hypothetical protein E2R66_18975 [Mucilaginibacter psychrotolerans]